MIASFRIYLIPRWLMVLRHAPLYQSAI